MILGTILLGTPRLFPYLAGLVLVLSLSMAYRRYLMIVRQSTAFLASRQVISAKNRRKLDYLRWVE